jgi:hypothetical protein
MSTITQRDLNDLISRTSPVCVSMYMPMRDSSAVEDDCFIRFKKMVTHVIEELVINLNINIIDARALFKPVFDLVNSDLQAGKQQQGLCLFVSPGFYRLWHTPLAFEENAFISTHFHVKEILPLVMNDQKFNILFIRAQSAKLFICEADAIDEKVMTVMKGSDDIMPTHKDIEKLRRFPSRVRNTCCCGWDASGRIRSGGVSPDADKRMYFLSIDNELRRILKDKDDPLVLAGAGKVCAQFKKSCYYPNIMTDVIDDCAIEGNPEELYAKALKIIQSDNRRRLRKFKESFKVSGYSRQAAGDLKNILRKAYHGLVRDLYLTFQSTMWGTFDPSSFRVSVHHERCPEDEDLLDLAAYYTLRHGGRIFALPRKDMPWNSDIAAVFRDQ